MASASEHPFHAWLQASEISYEEAAKRCARLGIDASADYLQQIAKGYYCPSYKVSRQLSERLCKGAVTVDDFAKFPYTLRPCTWAA